MFHKTRRYALTAVLLLSLAALTTANATEEWKETKQDKGDDHGKQSGHQHDDSCDHDRDRNHDYDRRDELLRVPGGSADQRARDALEPDYPTRPVPWVDTGPATDVDGQLQSVGDLLNSRPRQPAGPNLPVGPSTPGIVDDPGLNSAEEIADPLCHSSDSMAGANERFDLWGATYCADKQSLDATNALREDDKKKGKDPDKLHGYTPQQMITKGLIEGAIRTATGAARTSCGTKITCKKVKCTTRCDATFDKMLETIKCKKKRRVVNGKPTMVDRLRVNVIGNCACTCAAKSACLGTEAAL